MAINFPSTAGQATDGTFTYVVAGITYSWNGESWTAAGGGATATDRTVFSATNAAASGGGSLSYNFNDGVFTFTPPDLSSYLTGTGSIDSHTDVNITSPQNNDVLSWSAANLAWENFSTGTGSGFDADLLDGQHGTYYTNASNLNAGTLSSDRLSGSYNISVTGQAGSLASLGNITNVDVSNGIPPGTVLQYDGTNWVPAESASVRLNISYTAVNLGNGGVQNFSIATPKTYALLKIETSHAAWVTLYTDTNSRTLDQNRSQQTDPTPGSGVLAEVITSSATTQLISPGTICYNSTGSNITYGKIVNNSGSTVSLQVTLTYVSLEI